MEIQFLQRNIFQRIFGKPATGLPENDDCWQYAGGRLTISLDDAPELQQDGGALRLEGDGLPERVLVVRGNDGEFRAYKNRCTHVGHRRLDPVPGTNTVQCCSISKSTFDADGKVIFGPAPASIHGYPVVRDGEQLIVTLS